MTYKLYYVAGTASMGIRVLLEEIGAPYELIQTTTDRQTPRPAEQLKINPNGWVPVLLWGENAMYECAAITIFLCDRHAEANLAPAIDAPERGLYLQTLVYFSSSVQTAFQLDYHAHRFANSPEDEPGAQRRGCRRLKETWQVIDDQIGDSEWILLRVVQKQYILQVHAVFFQKSIMTRKETSYTVYAATAKDDFFTN